MFDYIQNIRSHHTVPCTTVILHTVMRSTIVGQTCAEIADCHEQMLRGEMSREIGAQTSSPCLLLPRSL